MRRLFPTLLILSVLFSSISFAQADLKDELNLVNRRLKQNKKQLEETRKYEKHLVVKKEVTLDEWQSRKAYLDEVEIALATTNASIAQTRKEIADARETLSVKGKTVDKKRDEVGKLLTFVHKFSGNRFVEYVLSADSFSELTGRARFANHILNGTVAAIEKLHDESALVEHTRLKLEQKKQELKELEAKQKTEQDRYTRLAEISKQQLAYIEGQQKSTKEQVKKIEKNIEYDQAKIAWFIKKIAEEEARRKKPVTVYKGKFMWPINGPLVSGFGPRIHPIWRTRAFHEGIDLDAKMGTQIVAAGDGLVTFAGWMEDTGFGIIVVLSHGNGLRTFYAHMSRVGCRVGQEVKKGQTIGYIGSTGRSTGPHLHLEFRQGKVPQNPLNYLPPR